MFRSFRISTVLIAVGLAAAMFTPAPAAAQTTGQAGQLPAATPFQTTPAQMTTAQSTPTQVTTPAPVTTTPQATSTQIHQVTVPIAAGASTGGTFSGTLALTSFAVQNGQLVALGTVTGMASGAGAATTSVITNVALPVTMGQASCQALNMTLGPATVTVTSLQLSINQVVVDLTAQTGAPSALSTLLCSGANLQGNPSGLADLLNQVLATL